MSNGIASLVNFDPNRNVFSFADSYTAPVVEDIVDEDEEVIVEDPVETLDTIIREGGGSENNPYGPNYNEPNEDFGYESWSDMFADISDGVSNFFGMDEDDDDEEGFSLTNNRLVNTFRSIFNNEVPADIENDTQNTNTNTTNTDVVPAGPITSSGPGFHDGGGQTNEGFDGSKPRDGGNPAGYS